MTRMSDQIVEEAIAWRLRQDDMDAAGWLAFVEWLEADPRHGEAYDRIALADGVISGARFVSPTRVLPAPANDRGTPGWRRFGWIGAATGCAVTAAAVALILLRPADPEVYAVQTAPGETRQVALGEGSRVEIAGGSRLLLDRANPRQIVVEHGEALFHVRHDSAHPFSVRSGSLEVLDVGTVFNVMREGRHFSVAVAEGSVLFQPRGAAIALSAGATLDAREDKREVHLGRVDPGLVGGWRNGRLSFSDTPVTEILGEINRLSGLMLVAEQDLSARRVTGIITLSGEAQRDVPHIASLIGANWQKDGERWILSPRSGATP